MMQIENNLLAITNCMFKDRTKYKYLTSRQKEEFFFIINRLLAKRYLRQAELLNNIYTDKAAALDAWFVFMSDKAYPSWMWEKGEKATKQEYYSDIRKSYDIHQDDIALLEILYKDKLEEEQNFLNKQK